MGTFTVISYSGVGSWLFAVNVPERDAVFLARHGLLTAEAFAMSTFVGATFCGVSLGDVATGAKREQSFSPPAWFDETLRQGGWGGVICAVTDASGVETKLHTILPAAMINDPARSDGHHESAWLERIAADAMAGALGHVRRALAPSCLSGGC